MDLKAKGKAVNVREPMVVRVTRNPLQRNKDTALLVEDYLPNTIAQFETIVSTLDLSSFQLAQPYVHQVRSLNHLNEGDLIVINTDGVINTLYRVNSDHNFLLVTERCNSNCLMCSQPPRDRQDIDYLHQIHKQLIPLIPKSCQELGITGGEPTLMGDSFFELLEFLKYELPESDLHCLTNGRSFAWKHIADRLGDLNLDRLMLGIPLYSDFYQQHDYIVQAKGAFNQTMQGLYNLAANNQRIEIRIVLQKQSISRLVKLAKYIYRNLPFVEHVAFMGLEHQGYTPYNIDKLWIDPVNYVEELGEAVEFLSGKDMNVSIYNSQLCLMPESLWEYNRKSISDWKNIYLDECSKCAVLETCGGLFASGQKKHSEFLKAI